MVAIAVLLVDQPQVEAVVVVESPFITVRMKLLLATRQPREEVESVKMEMMER